MISKIRGDTLELYIALRNNTGEVYLRVYLKYLSQLYLTDCHYVVCRPLLELHLTVSTRHRH